MTPSRRESPELSTPEGIEQFKREYGGLNWNSAATAPSRRPFDDPNLARDLYYSYLSLAHYRVGGNIRVHISQKATAIRLQARINRCLDETTAVQNGMIAPVSRWHALLFLLRLGAVAQAKIGPLAFRGHANEDWELQPTLWRITPKEQIRQRMALDALGRRLKILFALFGKRWRPEWTTPIGQHYQIATSFLDWTTDPMVAMSFATMEQFSGKAQVVLAYSVPRLIQMGASLVMPPPWAERVHRQLGFFLEATPEELAVITREVIKIRLPPSPELRPMRVYRDANPVPILADPQHLKKLCDACREYPHARNDLLVVRWYAEVMERGLFDEKVQAGEANQQLYEFLYRSCIVENWDEGGSSFNAKDLRKFARQNLAASAELSSQLIQYGQASGSSMDEGLGHFLQACLYPARLRRPLWNQALKGTWIPTLEDPYPVMKLQDLHSLA